MEDDNREEREEVAKPFESRLQTSCPPNGILDILDKHRNEGRDGIRGALGTWRQGVEHPPYKLSSLLLLRAFSAF